MASLQGGGGEREADWDLDTDEIQSLDSDGLHSSRPNRWQGTQSAWLGITEQDRLESTALDLVRNRDLSIHLYNAFALKHRRQRAQSTREQDTKETADQEAEDSGDWAPPALWTAWPLREDRLPLDDFMRGPQDDDDVFTFRRQSDSEPGTTPSSPLEEMVSATVLKLARERFLKRRLAQQQQQPRKHDEMDVASPSRAVSDDDADIMEEDMAEGEEQNAADVTAGEWRRPHPRRLDRGRGLIRDSPAGHAAHPGKAGPDADGAAQRPSRWHKLPDGLVSNQRRRRREF